MNREIKFRGKDAITGKWAYGFYYPSKGHSIIRDEKDCECIVLPESVGQFTGLCDKNGKEIYEDINACCHPFNNIIQDENGLHCNICCEKLTD